jgi:hypothetical protein
MTPARTLHIYAIFLSSDFKIDKSIKIAFKILDFLRYRLTLYLAHAQI